ncbi:conserved hypothetical protein [Verticillium alfalfae VaMs.102]|uniref:Uncharacterized protein n=1 Tax=Verticillium alfalfae (strain VaMs.102 / ATCC MYA-4576 / FGSC 10136) TaxID=526221 RepID=C9S6M8_VERA1|nr:conserved hypothetical protein [Verticillium alfalfae VaMs.102]EEY14519.1 conserved hypothetical protein [Verticillium alfalfae VaMs.102]
MVTPTDLVIVCCHGVWTGGPTKGSDESEWLIADFQAGETPTFVDHIKAGLQCISENHNAVLVFSGGSTRRETRLSEAQSYANLASANNYFDILPTGSDTTSRIFTEEQALDSYHNVLFSVIAFWRRYDFVAWPQLITIVSHAFKRARIVEGHCSAIGFPLHRVVFHGLDPPGMTALSGQDVRNQEALAGVQVAVDQWQADPHGAGQTLAGKRAKRNHWLIDQALFRTEEERIRSGIQTTITELGGVRLSDEGFRPWA